MVKMVAIKGVPEEDWDVITSFANETQVPIADLIHFLAEVIRERQQNNNRRNIGDFLIEQQERRRAFIRERLGGDFL